MRTKDGVFWDVPDSDEQRMLDRQRERGLKEWERLERKLSLEAINPAGAIVRVRTEAVDEERDVECNYFRHPEYARSTVRLLAEGFHYGQGQITEREVCGHCVVDATFRGKVASLFLTGIKNARGREAEVLQRIQEAWAWLKEARTA
jgi:hypothetical protein